MMAPRRILFTKLAHANAALGALLKFHFQGSMTTLITPSLLESNNSYSSGVKGNRCVIIASKSNFPARTKGNNFSIKCRAEHRPLFNVKFLLYTMLNGAATSACHDGNETHRATSYHRNYRTSSIWIILCVCLYTGIFCAIKSSAENIS